MEIRDPNEIIAFFHCADCSRQCPSNESMEKWTRFNVGVTSTGIRVWCVRHRKQVVHLTPEDLTKVLAQPMGCGYRHAGPPSN